MPRIPTRPTCLLSPASPSTLSRCGPRQVRQQAQEVIAGREGGSADRLVGRRLQAPLASRNALS
jgi:hypothetical protein